VHGVEVMWLSVLSETMTDSHMAEGIDLPFTRRRVSQTTTPSDGATPVCAFMEFALRDTPEQVSDSSVRSGSASASATAPMLILA
jgi:hypothetical protein